jgi:O-antigen ligase
MFTRLEAWRILGEIIAVNPVLGLGFANYHWYTPLFPILGYGVKFNSHNNYVDIVAQTGFLGLAAFFWFAVSLGLVAWRLRRRAAPGFQRAYAYGAIGGLAGSLAACMLGDWLLPFVYNIGLGGFRSSVIGWLFLGGILALDRIAERDILPKSVP